MRASDYQTACAVTDSWKGVETPSVRICPLLADIDGFLRYLEEIGLRPGYAIDHCPVCGEEHRWVLIKAMLAEALYFREANSTLLLQDIDKSLDTARALYGSAEGFRSMELGARKHFSGLLGKPNPPQHFYRIWSAASRIGRLKLKQNTKE
jgi:hypothetical protein